MEGSLIVLCGFVGLIIIAIIAFCCFKSKEDPSEEFAPLDGENGSSEWSAFVVGLENWSLWDARFLRQVDMGHSQPSQSDLPLYDSIFGPSQNVVLPSHNDGVA